MPIDSRIPVLIERRARVIADSVLLEFELAGPHPANCTCCGGRSPVAIELTRLFTARARGEIPFFHRVVARPSTPAEQKAILAALADDAFASARYRLAGTS